WRGDFSAFDTPGRYRIRITLDDETDLSWPFEIGENVLWARTSVPAYQFFYYQRCGMAIPGFHGACHLDDATNEAHTEQYGLAGGWHDAGDYNTYHNAPYVYGLSRAYTLLKDQFDEQDTDGNGMADFLDEILWG
ncbi:MAG: glycoside hydrolase family 9 protein, partial [Candidatus Hydrogenedentes bacterium]|nr:glycoside hydrolase family 9 protein [Candidatus Hydrogenedentota bacterium]